MKRFRSRKLPRGIQVIEGYVYIRIQPNGREYKQCFGLADNPANIDMAVSRLNAIREEIKAQRFGVEQKAVKYPLDEAVEYFMEHHAKGKPSSYVFQQHFDHILPFMAKRNIFFVDAITRTDWEDYRKAKEKEVSARTGKLFSPSTINKHQCTLTTFYNKLRQWKRDKKLPNIVLPDVNPTEGIKDADERHLRRKRIVKPLELQVFLSLCSPRLQRIVLGAVNSTLRLKTLRQLTTANVAWEGEELHGQQSKSYKTYAISNNEVMQWLVATATGGKLFDFTGFEHEWKKVMKRFIAMGYKPFQVRDLRQTGGRTMVKGGIDAATAQEVLGHSDIRTTQLYIGAEKEDLVAAGKVISAQYGLHLLSNRSENRTEVVPASTAIVLQTSLN